MLVLLIILVLFGVFGGGYWGRERFGGYYGGGGIGLGAVLVICLIIWLLGGFSSFRL